MGQRKMARPRSPKNRGLPPNLHYDVSRGVYRYRNPISGKRTYLSRDRQQCIAAANKLNAMLIPADHDLVARVAGGGQSWKQAVDRYLADVFPELELAPKTEKQYRAYLRKLRDCELATRAVADITVSDVVATLDDLTSGRRMRNVYRHQFIQVFRYTVELGWRDDNPAEVTRIVNDKRQRERLTMYGYRAIYEQADPWLRVAMDLALQTLQRREDLVEIRYSDIQDGRLHVRQQKTGRKLRLAVGAELQRVIDASRDGKVCPYIIHHRPRRIRQKQHQAAERQHPMQVFPDKLTREFRNARNASGFYARSANPPTFHEIRSLGADRYRDQGWPEERIQSLLGHEDVDMTRAYLQGHEPPWEDVPCGLRDITPNE